MLWVLIVTKSLIRLRLLLLRMQVIRTCGIILMSSLSDFGSLHVSKGSP